jgi:hypothetical protein
MGDLHVFNVEGIIAMQDGSTSNFPTIGKTIATSRLVNASGYSPYLDSVLDDGVFETDADIHPYILHFADYSSGNFDASNPMGFDSVTDPPPSGNLVMAMGCDYDYRDYVFNLTENGMTMTFAIGCTYAVSSEEKSQRFSPEYRIPQHLKKAASEINVIPPAEMLKESDPSAEITLQIEVVDPSHGITAGEALDEMLADSSVAMIEIEIPGVLNSTHSQAGSAAVSGTGHDPADPLLYEFTFANEQSAVEGIYPGLVKVTDSYAPGLNELPLLNGMDGIKRVDPVSNTLEGLFDITEFATYQAFYVEVEFGHVGSDPVADITRSAPGCAPANVTYDASGSTDVDDDPLSIPLNFEFDFDYDGVTFDIDRAMSTDPIAVASYPTRGCYTAAVRVYDSNLNTDIATIVVPVGDFIPGGAEVDITDGSSITNIDFLHGLPPYLSDTVWCGSGWSSKGTAKADGYIYIVFYGTQTGTRSIFFARSADDGATWSVPVSVHDYDSSGMFGGCSIAADDLGRVFITWTDHYHRDFVLEYSLDNGDSFTTNVIRDASSGSNYTRHHYRHPDVAIDPTDPNNITLSVQSCWTGYTQTSWAISFSQMYAHHSSTGPDGTFDEVLYISDFHPDHTDNVYQSQIHYAVDGDAYLVITENCEIYTYRSSDHGATFPDDAQHRMLIHLHSSCGYREMDVAFDPNDPDVYYVLMVRRTPWIYNYPIIMWKSTDGLNLTQIQSHINDNTGSTVHNYNPSITVNDAGVIYVLWQSDQTGDWEILADYSCDGGLTFGTDITFNTIDVDDEIDVDTVSNTCGDGVICIWEQNGNSSNGKLVLRSG